MIIREDTYTPKYVQLKMILKSRLKKLSPGDRLTSERELMKQYHLSQTTVARALNELEEEGIVYRLLGRGTFISASPGQNQKLIGVIVPDTTQHLYMTIVAGIEHRANDFGYHIILGSSHYDPRGEVRQVEEINKHKVSGLISRPSDGNIKLYKTLRDMGLHFVWILGYLDGIDSSYVKPDDKTGGYIATRHLLELGHRRILFFWFMQDKDHEVSSQILQGAAIAFDEFGLILDDSLVETVELGDGKLTPKELAKRILSSNSRPTAIFCYNDLIANDVFLVASELSINVPRDISIMGYDDSIVAESMKVPLTSVAIPKHEIGKCAFEVLHAKMIGASKSTEKVVLKPKLVVRKSTASPS